jgi:hypothetical protein
MAGFAKGNAIPEFVLEFGEVGLRKYVVGLGFVHASAIPTSETIPFSDNFAPPL